jgi:hypothetical protein
MDSSLRSALTNRHVEGPAAARPGDRIEITTPKSKRRPAINQSGKEKQDMYSDVEAGCLAWIEYQTELR